MQLPDPIIGSAEIIADQWLNASGIGPFPTELVGRQLRVNIESGDDRPLLTLLLLLDQNTVRLLPDQQHSTATAPSETVDATISGTPRSLIMLLLNKSDERVESARISGDLQLVKNLAEHLHHGSFSLETLLASWTGPQAAYHLSQWADTTREWLITSGKKLSANLADYLQYEKEVLVNPQQWQELTEEIIDLERLAGALRRRLATLAESKP